MREKIDKAGAVIAAMQRKMKCEGFEGVVKFLTSLPKFKLTDLFRALLTREQNVSVTTDAFTEGIQELERIAAGLPVNTARVIPSRQIGDGKSTKFIDATPIEAMTVEAIAGAGMEMLEVSQSPNTEGNSTDGRTTDTGA